MATTTISSLINKAILLDLYTPDVQTKRELDEYRELVKELKFGLDHIQFIISKSRSAPGIQQQHALTSILGECCCSFWGARIKDGGDFCPDCAEHGPLAGRKDGQVIAISGRKKRR